MTRTVDGLEIIQRLGRQYEEALKAAGFAAGPRQARRDGAADRHRQTPRDVRASEPRAGKHTGHRA